MAELGNTQQFKASHGSRNIKKDAFKVELILEGKIESGFVKGLDHIDIKRKLKNVVGSLNQKYLDDIVGRATNENIAQYIWCQLKGLHIQSIKVYEGKTRYAAIFQSDMNLNQYPAQLHFNKGQSLLLRQKPEQAISELSQAIKQKDDFAEAYNLRGRCQKYLGRYALALADYLKAIKLENNFGEAYRNLGNAYYYLNKTSLMIPAFTKAIKLMPQSALAWNNRGFAYQKIGQFEKAIKDHDRAIALDKNYAEAHQDRADALKALGNKSLANQEYKTAKELAKRSKDSSYGLGMR